MVGNIRTSHVDLPFTIHDLRFTTHVKLHLIWTIYSFLHCSSSGGVAAAWQVQCGRIVFEHSFEHCFWSTRDGYGSREDYDWRRISIYADRVDAFAAGGNGAAFSIAVNRGRAIADATGFSLSDARGFSGGKSGS